MTISEKDEWAEKEANAIVDEIILGITGNAARLVGGQPLLDMPLGERLRKFAAEADKRGYERGQSDHWKCQQTLKLLEEYEKQDEALLRECLAALKVCDVEATGGSERCEEPGHHCWKTVRDAVSNTDILEKLESRLSQGGK